MELVPGYRCPNGHVFPWALAVKCPDCAASVAVEPVAHGMALHARIRVLEAALFECAKASGEDVSDGPPTDPPVEVWALRAVREARDDYDEALEEIADADARIRRLEAGADRLRARLAALDVYWDNEDAERRP